MTTALTAATLAQTTEPATAQRGNTPIPEYLVNRGVPGDVPQLVRDGRFAEAEKAIDRGLAESPPVDAASQLRRERERLARVRRDFSLTSAALVEKLKTSIPDVTTTDIETWHAAGHLMWLEIDGETRYFRREPSNLFRFSDEARRRRDAAKEAADKASPPTEPAGDPAARRAEKMAEHAARAMELARDTKTSVVLPVRIRATHTIGVKPGPVPPGETIRVWMPYPKETIQQGAIQFIVSTPIKNIVASNDAGQRTIYMEAPAQADKPTTFTAVFEYATAAFVPGVDPANVEYAPDDPVVKEFTQERLPHLPLNDEVRTLAGQIVGGEVNPYHKAKLIWDWIQDNIRYSSEMEYCIMPSAVEKIMAVRHGDCGVQALLFIALCRAEGVAARWQSGWVTRPGSWNMHDWAEFYAPPYGWIPADPSIGRLKSDDPAIRDFLFGNMDAYRFIANSDWDVPFVPAKEHWRSDPVDNQRGEVEWTGGNLYYDDWTYQVEIDHLDDAR